MLDARKQSRAFDVYVNGSASRFDYVTACAFLIGLRTLLLSRNDFIRNDRETEQRATFDIRVAGDDLSGLSARFLPPA